MSETLPDLAELLDSWQLALEAEHKARSTVVGYGWSVKVFLKWCDQSDTPPVLDKVTVQKFLVHLRESGAAPATSRTRYAALRRYSAWLAEENELPTDPLIDLKPPKLTTKVTRALTDDQHGRSSRRVKARTSWTFATPHSCDSPPRQRLGHRKFWA